MHYTLNLSFGQSVIVSDCLFNRGEKWMLICPIICPLHFETRVSSPSITTTRCIHCQPFINGTVFASDLTLTNSGKSKSKTILARLHLFTRTNLNLHQTIGVSIVASGTYLINILTVP